MITDIQTRSNLQGSVAFITGAGAGIARQAAKLFAAEGCAILIAEHCVETGTSAAEELQVLGANALFVHTDITKEDSVHAAVAKGVDAFGKIDILFNCAGGSRESDGLITEIDIMAAWQDTMHVNLLGMMLCCKHIIPAIAAAGGGSVINMSSAAALRGASPYHIYTAAKGAILSLTRALAGTHARDNIRVNAICSGRVQTERNVVRYGPDGKGGGTITDRQDAAGRTKAYPFWLGQSEDMARIALFLACDDSRMITGASIAADGGRSAY